VRLLVFLNVSVSPPLVVVVVVVVVVARGRAEGNRGRGLMVMWDDALEGGSAVAAGNGIVLVGVAAGLRRPVPGGYASLFRRGKSADGTGSCAASRLVEDLGRRSAETLTAHRGSEVPRGRPSTASTTRRKSRRAARHSFSFFESKAQSSASAGMPRAVQNIVFLHTVGSLENICIVRSLRENRILIVDVAIEEITAVVDRRFVLISISARGSFAMRVHTKVPSYMTT
jgi:hypothetical protein